MIFMMFFMVLKVIEKCVESMYDFFGDFCAGYFCWQWKHQMGVTSGTSEKSGWGFRWCDKVCVKEEVADFVFIICRFTLNKKRCIPTIKNKKDVYTI